MGNEDNLKISSEVDTMLNSIARQSDPYNCLLGVIYAIIT